MFHLPVFLHYARCLWRPEESIRSLKTAGIDNWHLPCWRWEPKLILCRATSSLPTWCICCWTTPSALYLLFYPLCPQIHGVYHYPKVSEWLLVSRDFQTICGPAFHGTDLTVMIPSAWLLYLQSKMCPSPQCFPCNIFSKQCAIWDVYRTFLEHFNISFLFTSLKILLNAWRICLTWLLISDINLSCIIYSFNI